MNQSGTNNCFNGMTTTTTTVDQTIQNSKYFWLKVSLFVIVTLFGAQFVYFKFIDHDVKDKPKSPNLPDLNVYNINDNDKTEPAARNGHEEPLWKKKTIADSQESYSTYITLDKPIYRPGETLHFKSVFLHSSTRETLNEEIKYMRFLILDSNNVAKHKIKTKKEKSVSLVEGTWKIPESFKGGDYVIKLETGYRNLVLGERKFSIRKFNNPKLFLTTTYDRNGYSAGETVKFQVDCKRDTGDIPKRAKIKIIARIDGSEIYKTNDIMINGKFTSSIELPNEIRTGEGLLSIIVNDGGIQETSTTTLPILLQNMTLKIYPESGNVVSNVENKIYVEAISPITGDPMDFCADVVDQNQRVITSFKTEHEGRGVFSFTPQKDMKYQIFVKEPKSIRTTFNIPPSIEVVTLSLNKVFYERKEDIGVIVKFEKLENEEYHVNLYKKGSLLSSMSILSDAHLKFVKFNNWNAVDKSDGVLIVNIFNKNQQVLAERLTFVKPEKELKITINSDKSIYSPKEKVKITINVKDQKDLNVANATIGLWVTDEAVNKQLEKRMLPPSLKSMVFLENEVDHLEDADIYLSTTEDIGIRNRVLDLLLGTQGWRKYAFFESQKFREKFEEKFEKLYGFVHHDVFLAMKLENGRIPRKMDFGIMDMLFGQQRKYAPLMTGQLSNIENVQEMYGAFKITESKKPLTGQIKKDIRSDFRDTILWKPSLKTDDTGTISIEFPLSDSISTFNINVDSFTNDGVIGCSTSSLVSKKPFYNDVKLPYSLSVGDHPLIPVNLVNNLDEKMTVQLKLTIISDHVKDSDIFNHPHILNIDLNEKERKTQYFDIGVFPVISGENIKINIESTGVAGKTVYNDNVIRSLKLLKRGFLESINFGGLLEGSTTHSHTLKVPSKAFPETINASIKIYSSPVSNIMEALNALIREPYGCFEQTSSTTYPLVMAKQYFDMYPEQSNKDIVEKADTYLKRGYEKLLSFETSTKGFEWFGDSPGHEALSAYGLLQFLDMSKVFPVDRKMIQRTQKWLMSRKSNDTFLRDPKSLDSFGRAPDHITTAYIVWSLTYAKIQGLDKQIEMLVSKASSPEYSEDSYFLGLVSGILFNVGRNEEGKKFARKLIEFQNHDGSVVNAKTSITSSSGDSLLIETTAISVLSWMNDDEFMENVQKSIKWLTTRCKDGKFGSTQGTVLALKAIIAYDLKFHSKVPKSGEISLFVDEKKINTQSIDPNDSNAILIGGLEKYLVPGKEHQLKIQIETKDKKQRLSYSIDVHYNIQNIKKCKDCKLSLSTKLTPEKVKVGEPSEIQVSISNLKS